MVRAVLAVAALAAAGLLWRPEGEGPRYNAEGELLLPQDFERWIAVGSSVGLGYSQDGGGAEMFHSVLMEPTAYDAYRSSGRFPEGTMLALVIRHPAPRAAPARSGLAAGPLAAVELAVKDSPRFPGRWAYFDFGPLPAVSAPALPRQRCQACHAAHAERDNVFLQFYPLLRERLGPRGP